MAAAAAAAAGAATAGGGGGYRQLTHRINMSTPTRHVIYLCHFTQFHTAHSC